MGIDAWESMTWGDLVSLEYGKALKGYGSVHGEFQVFGTNGPVGWTDKYLVNGPAVILGRKGAYRGVHYSATPIWVIDTAYYLRPKLQVDMRWLYYAVKFHELGDIDDGSPIPSTTRAAVYVRPVRVPPLETQEAIGSVLSALDDKIALNRRMNETLEEIARTLFKSWFVDFEPVRIKARGGDPVAELGISPEITALFPDSLTEWEGETEIPTGWTRKPLSQVGHFLNGLALQKYPAHSGELSLPVIKIAELRRGITNATDRASLSIPADYVVNNGDLLFSWSGSLEVRRWSRGRGALNQHLFKVMSPDYPEWLCYWWISEHLPWFRQIAASKATTMGHIQRRHLVEAQCTVPDIDTLAALEGFFKDAYDLTLENEVESAQLAKIIDELLPLLLRGELILYKS